MNDALTFAPAVAEWIPFAKTAGFFLATFVLEDVAAIGAGLSLASGQITWPSAFLACFLGIWLGDAGLYVFARVGGRRWFENSSLKRFSEKVERSERWFARRGTAVLIFSRIVPGARLPTYLAAGFLRVPLARFLVVTGTASLVWTFVVLGLTQTFGTRLIEWLKIYKHGGLIAAAIAIALVVVLQLARRKNARRPFPSLARFRHWEFWPAWMFYPPVAIYCLWLAIRYRGLTLPTAANPGIFSGGLIGESKFSTLRELSATSPEFVADAELIPHGSFSARVQKLEEAIERLGLNYPFILKPDVGQRGVGVKLIRSRNQTERYLRENVSDLVIQRYAAGPHEAGVFYYRFPHEPHGRIFAITEKIFPKLTGDGRSTVAELIERDARARFVSDTYLKRFAERQDEVLAEGEELQLVQAGNHAQGCIFRDGIRLRSPALEMRIDDISRKLNGFFIGRYDIRFESEADLLVGTNFQIIELNGAASEATSIYDARNSLFAAYRMLFQQWDLVFAIGAANRRRGHAPTKLPLIWKTWREYSRVAATYPTAD